MAMNTTQYAIYQLTALVAEAKRDGFPADAEHLSTVLSMVRSQKAPAAQYMARHKLKGVYGMKMEQLAFHCMGRDNG